MRKLTTENVLWSEGNEKERFVGQEDHGEGSKV